MMFGVSLLGSFVVAFVGGPMFRKDALTVMFWGALFSPLGAVVALMLLPELEGADDDQDLPVKKKLSKKQQRDLDEAARKMGLK